MQPNDIPVITGATGGAGGASGAPPVSVQQLASFAADSEAVALGKLRELRESLAADVNAAADRADTGIGTLYVDAQNAAVAAAKRAVRGQDVIFRSVRDAAAEAESRAHAGIAGVGGVPYLMTEEAYGVNQAGAHETEAVYRIISPAVDQQERGESPTPVPAGAPAPGFPVDPGPGSVPPTLPEVPAPPVATPILPPTIPPIVPPLLIPPTAPPVATPTVPPTVPPAVPPGNCQSPCVNVVIDSSFLDRLCPPDTTPTAPTAPPVVPPVVDQPLVPVAPPVAVTPQAPIDRIGSFDGPILCDRVQDAVIKAEMGRGSEGTPSQLLRWAPAAQAFGGIPVIGPIIQKIIEAVGAGMDSVTDIAYAGMEQIGLPNPAAAVWSVAGGLAGSILDKWAGTDTRYYFQPLEQMGHYANPMNIIGQGEIDATYLSGGLTLETWECLTRMNGNLPWQHFQAMYAKRAKLSAGELSSLHLRGKISRTEFDQRMRENGYVNPADSQGVLQLSEYVPTTQELFTWLKKDVYNEPFVQRFGLDEDFPDPMPPAWVEWFRANGTTPEQIKYDYRSQWRLPSTTQLAELIARNRPGRVDPALTVTPEDADQLLKLDEWPAKMRGLILSTLTMPVNRTDLIEGYKAGTVSVQELIERLMDLRYSRDDAEFLARMIVAKAEGQQQGSMGAWTRRKIVAGYVDGTLGREAADKLLSRTVLDPQRRQDALDDADTIRSAKRRGACIKGIKRRYFTGEIGTLEARALMTDQGVDLLNISTIMGGWECERSSRSKEPTVKQLTEWAVMGIITPLEFERRLINLGFTKADADRIILAADISAKNKAAKAARPRK